VGDGPALSSISDEMNRLNLSDSVILCGIRTDMKNVYDKIDFVVIPSLREGLPYVLLEAMFFKIPVIASAVGDIPLLLKDRITGFLVQPGDIEGLAESMNYVLEHPNDIKSIIERSYSLVKDNYSVQTMINNTENLYLSLSKQRNVL
jgi:glycosyltransferase involved in cell wall biosynthesis